MYTRKYHEFVAVCIGTSNSMSNNANGNKQVIVFLGIAWYCDFNARSDVVCMTCST